MSQPITHLVWVDKAEWSHEWRRFVACLCFMLFYVEFVQGGTSLWVDGLREFHRGEPDQYHFSMGLLQIGVAWVSYLCGRSLWYRGRFARWWLIAAILSLVTLMSLRTHYCTPYLYGSNVLEKVVYFEDCCLTELPFAFVLLFSLWLSKWQISILDRTRRRWALVAALWCFVAAAIPAGSNLPFVTWSPFGGISIAGILLASSLSIATGALLLSGHQLARFAAVVLAAAEFGIAGFYTWAGRPKTIADYVTALYATVPLRNGPLPSPFPLGICYLNSDTFRWALVGLVLQAGPWILIAIYARRYPMRLPADDGSPWPRRYCGNCGYNLYGTAGEVCPECGCELKE